ncbi:M48 family metallopeptidase [Sulfuricurvum sp.]|uniref:M48 family metallopeptidase n=1 Tax=Sulfuricurvum sp. TaxID=2025608 RepID=UPI002D70745C|nr:M48 family metallopeptidase [Sulfuricurvum sp.]HZF69733.1 M48 family metallopeptidase [Sulfuricurvum sp.]
MHAWIYDLHSSTRVEAALRVDETTLFVESDQGQDAYDLASVTFSPRLGNTPRSIYLPDSRVCETQENDTIDALLKRIGRDRSSILLHFLESKIRYLLAAIAVTALFSYLFIVFALPAIAKEAAQNLPASMVYRLDASTLATLDKTLLKPSTLPQTRQDALRRYFLRYVNTAQEWPKVRILFRSGGKIGANAFALPDGSIVFTDDLIAMAKDDRELLSIFFHELGHVQKRHALQTVLQDTAFYLLLSSITGDVTTASSAFALLPTMLVESSYSRNMELEADDYAYEMMQRYHVEHKYFATIMTRLMQDTNESNTSVMRYLADHPLAQFRIDRFQKGE